MIYRKPAKDPWTAIPNAVLEDTRLSWKARGMLCYMLSRPDHWEFHLKHLATLSVKDAEKAVKSAFKELVEIGYARLEYKRSDDGRHAKGKCYAVSEEPKRDSDETSPSRNVTVSKRHSDEKGSLSNDLSEILDLGESKKKTQNSQKSSSPKNTPQRMAKSKFCPADWEPTPEVRTWAATKFPLVDFDEALEAMRDYEYRDGHTNWDAALRTWIRRSRGQSTHQKPEPVANNRISEKGYRSAMAMKRVMEETANGTTGSTSLFCLPEHADGGVS